MSSESPSPLKKLEVLLANFYDTKKKCGLKGYFISINEAILRILQSPFQPIIRVGMASEVKGIKKNYGNLDFN